MKVNMLYVFYTTLFTWTTIFRKLWTCTLRSLCKLMLLEVLPFTVYLIPIFILAKCNTSDLSGVSFICNFFAHIYSWSIFCWSLWQSSSLSTPLPICVSSAKLLISLPIFSSNYCINITNNSYQHWSLQNTSGHNLPVRIIPLHLYSLSSMAKPILNLTY